MDRLLPPLRFAAGVYLLTDEQTAELDKIRARTEGAVYLVEAAAYIEQTVDPAELERTAAKMLTGEIPLPVLVFVPEEGKPKR